MPMETKVCQVCEEEKNIGLFNKDKFSKDGVSYRCKICLKNYHKEYHIKNRDKISESNKIRYENNKEVRLVKNKQWRDENKEYLKMYQKKRGRTLNNKYSRYKSVAKSRNIDFNLTFEDFSSFEDGICCYCGETVNIIGLDRIDSRVGYVLENIQSCCTRCNLMKRHYSNEDFINHIGKILFYVKGL